MNCREEGVCGTPRGYSRHKRAGDPRCDPCWAAQATYDRARFKENPGRREQKSADCRRYRRQKLRAISDPVADAVIPDEAPGLPELDGDLPCRRDPEAWFPETVVGEAAPKKACRACPALRACRQWVLEHPQEHGVWAGLSERERRKIARWEAA